MAQEVIYTFLAQWDNDEFATEEITTAGKDYPDCLLQAYRVLIHEYRRGWKIIKSRFETNPNPEFVNRRYYPNV